MYNKSNKWRMFLTLDEWKKNNNYKEINELIQKKDNLMLRSMSTRRRKYFFYLTI